jgi:hypothetical protein
MQAHDREKFAMLIDSLAANFGKPAETALLEGYWMALEDLPLEAVARAVRSAIRQCQHMPRGAELRQLAGEMSNTTRAVHAWSVLQKAIGQHGAYCSVDFDDPVLNATVRNLGGWQKLCATTTDEFEKWTRKDFERIYGSLCASGVTEEQSKYLTGIHEQNNTVSGHAVAGPTKIATGLPPHSEGIVRKLTAPERLALTAGENTPRKSVSEIVALVAERKGVA